MKKVWVGLLVVPFILALQGCDTNDANVQGTDGTVQSTVISSSEKEFFYETVNWGVGVDQNEEIHGDEDNKFKISGTVKEGEKVFLVDNSTGEVLANSIVNSKRHFTINCFMPDVEKKVLIFTTDTKADVGTVDRPSSLTNSMPLTFVPNAKLQEKADEEKRKRAEEQEKKRKEEEEKKRAEEEKKKQEEEAAAKKKLEEEAAAAAIAYDTGITYENLARNPDTYKGQKVKFSGRIIQVIKGENVSQYRFKINDDYNQVILIEISNSQLENNRILEDDYITIKGLSYGEYTYSSTMGGEITVPAVVVDSFEFS